ncbi:MULTISPECIES: hypothetical protein [unclassified Micromonospora]|uniref:hypothetical protein n=1 Tax=unclassified Micromonospora TaxID=2617518 RepID=UPI001B387CD3|nr:MULTISPECIES: hypothetical protein [unclassified Micromonospora]MBQ1046642.1 hypothetical protein [Micromonospora sp. C72]MBQ1059009.1 hypothetical protein [Micromonospora sp. C32]
MGMLEVSFVIGTAAAGAVLIGVWIRTRHHRERVAILALVTGLLATVAAFAQVAMVVFPIQASPNPSPSSSPALAASSSAEPSPSSSAEPTAACKWTVLSGLARANPEKVGNLVFCPTRINNGDVPIAGPFTLEGQVIGPVEERRKLFLMVQAARNTCTTEGKPPAPGRFLLNQPVDFETGGGEWEYFDDLGGFPQSVTLGRTFQFATGSKDVVQGLYDRREEWRQEGITRLPPGITILATFKIAPGKVKGALPCGG